jgi:hypothetical protein
VSRLPALSALLLLAAGALAIGGSFGTLEEESERAGAQTLTLTYTSWRLIQGGTYAQAINFHAPHFGIPLVVTGGLAMVAGILLFTRSDAVVRTVAVAAAGLLVGTVWTVGLVVAADLDAESHGANFELDWTSGLGFWLVLAGGIAAVLGGLGALFSGWLVRRPTTVTVLVPTTPPDGPAPLPVFQPPQPRDPT